MTLYAIGTIKEIEGVRTYVSVDGGMSDNPRPVLYGSGYETFLPQSVDADRTLPIRLVGKHCSPATSWFVRVSCPVISRSATSSQPVTGA